MFLTLLNLGLLRSLGLDFALCIRLSFIRHSFWSDIGVCVQFDSFVFKSLSLFIQASSFTSIIFNGPQLIFIYLLIIALTHIHQVLENFVLVLTSYKFLFQQSLVRLLTEPSQLKWVNVEALGINLQRWAARLGGFLGLAPVDQVMEVIYLLFTEQALCCKFLVLCHFPFEFTIQVCIFLNFEHTI